MNAYSKFMDISMHALPEPLTSADQSGYSWFKFAHVEYLLDPEITALSLEAQGALTRLMAHAGRQYPFASLPNDMQHLVKTAGFKLPDPLAKGYAKAYIHAEHVVESVLEATFILCSDDRYYCPLLTNELLAEPKSVSAVPTGQPNPPLTSSKKRSSSAERMQRKRDRERLLKAQQDINSNSDASHVTPENVTCDGSDTKCDGVTDSVTPKASHVTGSSVTNGGIKGGDLDLDSDLDSKKNKTNPSEASQQHDPDYFQTPELGWTPRLGLINAKLQMAGHKPVTNEFLLQILVTFNPHYDDKPIMSDNNRASKLVHWIGDKQQKAARQPQHKPSTSSKPDPNASYYGISKDDIQKYAKVGESEFDCAKRLASERNQANNPASNPVEKKTLPPTANVWSMGDKHTLKQILQIDSSITPEHIDAMAKDQGIDKGLVMAKLYQSLATKQKEQDVAAKRNKAGPV